MLTVLLICRRWRRKERPFLEEGPFLLVSNCLCTDNGHRNTDAQKERQRIDGVKTV